MSPNSQSDAHLEFRRARPDESDALTALAHEAKRHWGYRDEALASWRNDLTVAAETLGDRPTVVVEIDGELAGFYQLSTTGAVVELEHFWVRPAYMGRGIGRALLEHAAHEASDAGFEELQIDADPNAERFYQACGAVRYGTLPAPIDGQPQRVRPQLVLRTDRP